MDRAVLTAIERTRGEAGHDVGTAAELRPELGALGQDRTAEAIEAAIVALQDDHGYVRFFRGRGPADPLETLLRVNLTGEGERFLASLPTGLAAVRAQAGQGAAKVERGFLRAAAFVLAVGVLVAAVSNLAGVW